MSARGGATRPVLRLKDADRYAKELSKISEECKHVEECFTGRVMDGLTEILGPRGAMAAVHYMPGEWRSSPEVLVTALTDIFHEGADFILQRMVAGA